MSKVSSEMSLQESEIHISEHCDILRIYTSEDFRSTEKLQTVLFILLIFNHFKIS